jgi:hypothetical protein
MQNKMQNELTKEEGKSAGLQSLASAKGRHQEHSNVRKCGEELTASAAHTTHQKNILSL